jgi:sugar/nucleoside kinase (ribokinase family)
VRCDGLRVPQRLPDVVEWFRCFDAVQLNHEELALIGDDPMTVAATAMAHGVSLLVVTLGEGGTVYFTAGDHRFLEARQRPLNVAAPVSTERVAAEVMEVLDPTGCGDVFGGAMVGELVGGAPPAEAVRRANVLAGRNVRYRGATKLQHHLRGEIVPT